jgi:recombination protein RecR
MLALKEGIHHCRVCFNFSETETCAICQSDQRDISMICVVEDPLDIVAIERTGTFKGRYHVLHGAIAPIEGIGPEQLKVRELIERLRSGEVTEVIVATNPNLEGEATALYLQKLIKPLVQKVTRLASGLPMGGDLEYADELTLSRALDGRREY